MPKDDAPLAPTMTDTPDSAAAAGMVSPPRGDSNGIRTRFLSFASLRKNGASTSIYPH